MMIPALASAQVTATGTLSVTATVNGSINLIFNSDAAGVALTGSGTNAATLAFGNVSAFGAVAAGVVRTTTATTFTVSSAVDVNVSKTNSASANYTLKAQWARPMRRTPGSRRQHRHQRGRRHDHGDRRLCRHSNFPVAITVPFTTASGTVISNTINYTATAN